MVAMKAWLVELLPLALPSSVESRTWLEVGARSMLVTVEVVDTVARQTWVMCFMLANK